MSEVESLKLPLFIKEADLTITELFQLSDGRMEVKWEPVDRVVDEEIEYMSVRMDKPIGRTSKDVVRMNDLVHYLFTDKGLWQGLRCPKEMWSAYLTAKGYPEVDAFMAGWLTAPTKELVHNLPKKPIVIS